MSLVGTRPPTLDEWEKYEPHHRARMSFRPGLTGLWQVSGRSNITDFEEVVKLDTQYIGEWSVKGDVKIIFKTFVPKVSHTLDIFCRKITQKFFSLIIVFPLFSFIYHNFCLCLYVQIQKNSFYFLTI